MSTTRQGSTRIALMAVALCCCLTIALAGAAFWQHSVRDSKADDSVKHDGAATLFQQAEGEGQTAGQLLGQYVQTGDQALIQQINEHTSAGVTKLTGAVQQSGVNGQAFLDGGSALVQAEGQIIALRQAGDIKSAAAGLTALTTKFKDFVATQNAVIGSEQAIAADARDSASKADGAQSWLIVGAAIFALGAVASGIVFIRRSASRGGVQAVPTA